MTEQEKTRILLKGTAILAFAALLSKVLGVIYRVPYQNITGNLGFYVYQQVYPLYSILLLIATAGVPIAISKLVAERLAVGDEFGAKRIFKLSALTLTVSGILFFLLLYYTAPAIAAWMEDDRLVMPIRSVSFALLIVPVMSTLKGYYQGYQNMIPTATSVIVEQAVRVTTILVLSYWFMSNQYDEYYAGAGAVFGAVTGGVAAFIVLLLFWKKKSPSEAGSPAGAYEGVTLGLEGSILTQTQQKVEKDTFAKQSAFQIIKKVLYYAIPICIGALVLPLLQLVDSLTVVKVLIASDVPHEWARELKGIFDRGQPLIQFSAFFVTSLALALVPSISEAHAKGDTETIAIRSQFAMRLTLIIGLAAALGLAIVAEPVNIMLYKTDEGTLTLAVLAFTTIFSTIGVTSAAILQGLGKVMLPAKNLFYGVIVKIILNVLLIPWWGITGAALATVIAYAVATGLNVYYLRKLTKMKLTFKEFLAKPLLAVLTMAVVVLLVQYGLLYFMKFLDSERFYYTSVALGAVSAGVIAYALALLRYGVIRKEELQLIPKVNKLIPILVKLKFLKA